MHQMNKQKRKGGIILQVAILFALGVLTTGLLTYFSEQKLSGNSVKKQTELYAEKVADEVKRSVMEYPAHQWLLQYWYANASEMDIEYDASFSAESETAEKCRVFAARHPEIQIRYADAAQLAALPDADQRLYAEIAYSWLITRIDQIKQAYHIDYLFCVAAEEPYDTQFFLLSGADPGAARGTNYEEVYPLGNIVSVAESQQEAMRAARQDASHLVDAGDYMDYYAYLGEVDGHSVLIGMTYSLSALRADIETQTRTGALFAILNQVGLSLICLALIYAFVLRPLKKVQQNIRLYQDSKDSEIIVENLAKVRPPNEIGQLSEDVSDLAEEIDDYLSKIETITAEKERVTTELHMANQIQESMLPNIFPAFPERPEFDIYAMMEPAREVGGDFYDYFLIDEDHLCMVMADVSGKGVPAALFMMASKIILANNAMMGKSPAEILSDTNATICANNREEMFVTVWLGILEISTGKLTAANAGHEYPVVKNADGSFALYKDKHGLVIGAMDGIRYREYALQLKPGAMLFLYTDGVPEATDAAQQMFGTERMLAALNEQSDAAPEQILRNVRSSVDAFVQEAEQFDDLTMLCVQYIGPNTEDEKRGAGAS